MTERPLAKGAPFEEAPASKSPPAHWGAGPGGSARKTYPLRKVHLDFHNSEHVERVGDGLDPDDFAGRLLSAGVDAIVVFAKDMHGYFYYPSALGPVHPGLEGRDLLGAQVAACRAAGIAVYAYYCVTYDNYLAENHPEWLCYKRDRTTYLPRFDQTPGWTALCLSSEDYVDLMLEHSREILSRYDVDGIWYDMPAPNRDLECFCVRCLRAIRERGLDPLDAAAQRAHKSALMTDWLQRSRILVEQVRPGAQVDHNNQTREGLPARLPYLDTVDIEALGTGRWGYLYFPVMSRYVRGSGATGYYGLTSRFQRAWGDFGGLKHVNQLRVEAASIVAQAAAVDIGDQAEPSARLDPGVYDTIGEVYRPLAALEPYLAGAASVVEAVVIVDGLPLTDFADLEREEDRGARDGLLGLCKLLMEHHIQFDVAEARCASLNGYRLVVLPDGIPIDHALGEKLADHLAGGGTVIASDPALQGGAADWMGGVSYAGDSPYRPTYMRLEGELGHGFPDHDFALYEGASRWSVTAGDGWEVTARLGEPAFQRSPAHYTGHAQSPMAHLTEFPAVLHRNGFTMTAFPLGASYYRHGYWVYREVLGRILERALPGRVVRTSAPAHADVAVTRQACNGDSGERWIVHVVNFATGRRTPEHVEYFEEATPLVDVEVRVAVPRRVVQAHLAADGSALPFAQDEAGVSVRIPRVSIHELVVLELEPSDADRNTGLGVGSSSSSPELLQSSPT